MNLDYLLPVSDLVLDHLQLMHPQCLGNTLRIHSSQEGVPDLNEVQVVVIGLRENRRDSRVLDNTLSFTEIRKSFYKLFAGNWHITVADLGDVGKGESVEDTYFAIRTLTEYLVKKSVVSIFIGGSQDLIYPVYRAFDKLDQMVNLVNVDHKFDLGDPDKPIKNHSYVSKIIVDQPYNLFNYSNIGFQTYFNPQDEIDLMRRLHFEAYRLGNVSNNLAGVEPVMRDADVVSVDMGVMKGSELGYCHNKAPNGFDGKEICAIARYAGISDRVSVFGVFEYKNDLQEEIAAMLVAQLMWYFIEGVNFRSNENLDIGKNNFSKYQVPVDNEVLTFYKSELTERWWIEIPFISELNNKLKRHTLLPCGYNDYLEACDQNLPERWYKACMKNEI